eukprot:5803787-Pleurochrysis_carterae.AAC.2
MGSSLITEMPPGSSGILDQQDCVKAPNNSHREQQTTPERVASKGETRVALFGRGELAMEAGR